LPIRGGTRLAHASDASPRNHRRRVGHGACVRIAEMMKLRWLAALTAMGCSSGASATRSNPDAQASAGAICCDAGHSILASAYDQSCRADTDCVAISEGDPCVACAFSCASNAAINEEAVAQYESDIAGTSALAAAVDGGCFTAACRGTLSLPSDWGPFCCSGMCHVGSACSGPGDAGDAATE
jgi:hypothetical protein